MTTGEALLEATKANPDDHTPRLIYADYLDEQEPLVVDVECKLCCGSGLHPAGKTNGIYIPTRIECKRCRGEKRLKFENYHAARAELIRLGCKIDSLELPKDPFGDMASENQALLTRNANLEERVTRYWSQRIGFEIGKMSGVLSCGFIKYVMCSPEVWVEFGRALRSIEWVPMVWLSKAPDFATEPWKDGREVGERPGDDSDPDAILFKIDRWPGTLFTYHIAADDDDTGEDSDY